MRGFVLSLFLIICALSSFAQTQVAKKTSGGRGYLEYLPPNYASSSSLYPCIIFLHGSGERGDGSPASLEKVKSQGIPKLINSGSTMCFNINGKTECFIVLSPQQGTSRSSWEGYETIPFIQYALANYRIDPARLYLTGLSMGGDGTWMTSYANENNPNYLAAIAPVSCKGDYNGSKITAQRAIPVWDFYGSTDTAVPLNEALNPIGGMNTVPANPAPMWRWVYGSGHSAATWDKVYSTTNDYFTPNIYQWFLSNKKGTIGPKPPKGNAGADKTVTLPNGVSITGSATDPDGTISAYSWMKVSGGAATLTNANTATVSLTGLVSGTYIFRLTVTDNSGYTHYDDMKLTVNGTNGNIIPVANAGPDKTIILPTNSVSINGTGTDSDGTISTYAWTKTSGGPATLTNTTSANVTASALVAGPYVFRLTVTDNSGGTHSDDVTITVNAANTLPIANAGTDKVLTLPNNSIVINGTGTDANGTISSYNWTKTSGGSVNLTNTSTSNLTASQLTTGLYVFRLTVTDNSGGTHFDEVSVTVNSANLLPIANAGADKTISLPTNFVSMNGSGSDADGTIVAYAWTQTSGPTVATTSALNSPTLTISNCVQGVYIFSLQVTDNAGGTSVDDVSIMVFGATNQPPIVNAGGDRSLSLPNTSATLNATASDSDGSIVSYQWIQTWGPAATLSNANTSSLSFVGTTLGTYTVKLTVTDNQGLKSSSSINVRINKALPIANAGSDLKVNQPENQAVLQGIGTDPDGTITGYSWIQTSGPTAVINNPTLPTAQVSQLNTVGQYVFLLTVTDNDNQKASDFVTINVVKQMTSQSSSGRSETIQTETVEVQESSLVEESSSTTTSLYQNYPNPFSSSTTIPFSIKSDQRVMVKVYDFYGVEIQTLVNEELKAGEHTVVFTPSTPNQFYLIKLMADGKLHSIKASQL